MNFHLHAHLHRHCAPTLPIFFRDHSHPTKRVISFPTSSNANAVVRELANSSYRVYSATRVVLNASRKTKSSPKGVKKAKKASMKRGILAQVTSELFQWKGMTETWPSDSSFFGTLVGGYSKKGCIVAIDLLSINFKSI